MITSIASRPVAVHTSALLGVLSCCSCQVYDPSLLDEQESQRSIRAQQRTPQDAGTDEPDAAEVDAAVSCGDGVVSEGEACDIAIARGAIGACPNGCSGGQGCLRNELEGEDCDAHCVVRTWTEPRPDDGCCPAGRDFFEDNDCSPSCGNGHLEPGETCDPADTCPSRAACTSDDACVVARFSGAADDCDAACDMRRISSCLSGDGCCPPGCDHARDGDCVLATAPSPEAAPKPTPAPTPTPTPTPVAPAPPAFVCATAHKGTTCKACDCARCAPETEACLNDADAEDAKFCTAAVNCSELQRCNSGQCYCGTASADVCETMPAGKCVAAWEDAAYTTNPMILQFHARTPGYTLANAVALIDCRAKNCSKECGITP